MPRPAFTLIELLVVITIIVVLLALLTPALDRAVYQAELASCGGRLKALGAGFALYAFNNGRRYYSHDRYDAMRVADPDAYGGVDLRVPYRGYIDAGLYADPLSG